MGCFSQLKDEMTKKRTTPPMWFPCDLKTFDLSSLPCKFDVILVDPPWHEYVVQPLGSMIA